MPQSFAVSCVTLPSGRSTTGRPFAPVLRSDESLAQVWDALLYRATLLRGEFRLLGCSQPTALWQRPRDLALTIDSLVRASGFQSKWCPRLVSGTKTPPCWTTSCKRHEMMLDSCDSAVGPWQSEAFCDSRCLPAPVPPICHSPCLV